MANVLVQRISVPFEYAVHFTEDLFATENPSLADALSLKEPGRRHRMVAVIDRGVAEAWPELPAAIARYAAAHAGRVELAATWTVTGGEASKNDPAEVLAMHEALDRLGVDRQSFVVVIGGGAVLDMAGYAAATAHRGVRVIRVPTTVLSQADSGVGVKNGVNLLGKKNFLGTFAPPFAVLIDTRFLATLPRRDAVAGMSEAVKVALIRDAAFFHWIHEHRGALREGDAGRLDELVRRCAELHLAHIATSGDPFELGSARPLDFGHWAAHKLEVLTDHQLRHGEAVAIGMAIDTLYAVDKGIASAAHGAELLETLEGLGLRLWDDALDRVDASGRPAVLGGLAEFREHLGGDLTITLVREPGASIEVNEMDEPAVLAAIARLRERARSAA
jgi:3-dehydroquinate synthase